MRVFVSSTCYDLVDLREELKSHLQQNGFDVALSEDPNSAFFVDPLQDSIESCLENVAASDAIVAVVDRRYGGVLRSGKYEGRSATHAEVLFAREKGKPIYFFIRNIAFQEFAHMRKNGWDFGTQWVEQDTGETPNPRRERWFNFVSEISSLSRHAGWSNWCDQFSTSVDLRSLVVKRLHEAFPTHVAIQALRPDRVVRLTFEDKDRHPSGSIGGYFRNVGVGPAFDLVQGIAQGAEFEVQHRHGALGVGESHDQRSYRTGGVQQGRSIFCAYRNAYGDVYRVDVPVVWKEGRPYTSGEHSFSAGPPGSQYADLPKVN